MKTKINPIDALIEKEYYKQGNYVQIGIMDIPKIYADCRAVMAAGGSLEKAMADAIRKYRKN